MPYSASLYYPFGYIPIKLLNGANRSRVSHHHPWIDEVLSFLQMSAAYDPDQQGPQIPKYLLEGFTEMKWVGAAPNLIDPFTAPKRMVAQIKEDTEGSAKWVSCLHRLRG